MNALKPKLLEVLMTIRLQQLLTKEPASLINRTRMVDDAARVSRGVENLAGSQDPSDRRDRIPDAEETHAEPPRFIVSRERASEPSGERSASSASVCGRLTNETQLRGSQSASPKAAHLRPFDRQAAEKDSTTPIPGPC